jgi:hypothetical protein
MVKIKISAREARRLMKYWECALSLSAMEIHG